MKKTSNQVALSPKQLIALSSPKTSAKIEIFQEGRGIIFSDEVDSYNLKESFTRFSQKVHFQMKGKNLRILKDLAFTVTVWFDGKEYVQHIEPKTKESLNAKKETVIVYVPFNSLQMGSILKNAYWHFAADYAVSIVESRNYFPGLFENAANSIERVLSLPKSAVEKYLSNSTSEAIQDATHEVVNS